MRPSSIRSSRRYAVVALVVTALNARHAHAAPPCPGGANTVYITGSSAAAPFLTVLAHALLGTTPAITLVYQKPGSCVGVSDVLNGTPIDGQAAVYWSSDGRNDGRVFVTGVAAGASAGPLISCERGLRW